MTKQKNNQQPDTAPSHAPRNDTFTRRAAVVVGLVTAVVLLILFAWQIIDVLLLFFSGIVLAVFLTGVSGWIRQRTPLSHRQSLALTLLTLLGTAVLFGWVAAPSLIEQGEQLGTDLMESANQVQATLENQSWAQPFLNNLPDLEQLSDPANGILGRLSSLFSRTFNTFTDLIVILFIGLFLALDPDMYANGLIRLIPLRFRYRAGEVLNESAHTLRWWLLGRLASMIIVGVLSVIGLWLLNIPLAFILGALTGLLAFVPIVGPAIALIPPMLIAFSISPMQSLYVFLLYMGIQAVESYLITPMIQQRAVSLPPVVLILSQVIFGLFFNFFGLAVAAPFAAVLLVVTKMIYVNDILGDPDVELATESSSPPFKASQNAPPPDNKRQPQTPSSSTG